MFQVCNSILSGSSVLKQTRAGYQHFVMSEALKQLERECNRFCPRPRVPPQKVTVVGAGSPVGQMTSLFLKQQKIIKTLALYDDCPANRVLGVGTDLSHIDTSTEVEAYQGRTYLKEALYDADVVVICGGYYVMPPCCEIQDRDLFLQNMHVVRSVTLSCAQFCPHAVIAIQMPPVDANFALAMHSLKKIRCYDKRRLLGVNSISAMRANQLICSITGTDPTAASTPVVGGTGPCTRVPVFSAAKAANIPQKQIKCLTRLVQDADSIICKVKTNCGQGHLSAGFATARCVINIMQGLFSTSTPIDSALVEQNDPDKCFGMEVCSTPVTISKGGISEYAIPTLSDSEKQLLEDVKCDLKDSLSLGQSYALGEEYFLHPCKFYPCVLPPQCQECKPCD